MVRNAKGHELPHQNKSSVLQIKQDDKFFCRLLSKESSMSNPSFRVASVAVPFVWESQPGTPKYTFSEDTLPPLTPPPSYHFNSGSKTKRPEKLKSSRSNNIFMALLPKLNLKRIILSPSSSSSLSSSSLSSSWWTSSSSSSSESNSSSRVVPMARIGGRRRFLSNGSSFDFRGGGSGGGVNEDEEDVGSGSPNSSSTLCFRIPRATSSNNGFQSFYKRQAQGN